MVPSREVISPKSFEAGTPTFYIAQVSSSNPSFIDGGLGKTPSDIKPLTYKSVKCPVTWLNPRAKKIANIGLRRHLYFRAKSR